MGRMITGREILVDVDWLRSLLFDDEDEINDLERGHNEAIGKVLASPNLKDIHCRDCRYCDGEVTSVKYTGYEHVFIEEVTNFCTLRWNADKGEYRIVTPGDFCKWGKPKLKPLP